MRVRVNSNLKARSLRELEEEKKGMHIATFRYLIGELEQKLRELASGQQAEERKQMDTGINETWIVRRQGQEDIRHTGTVEALCEGIVEECRLILTKHERLDPEYYLNGDKYRYLVAESLETKEMGMFKFLLWLHSERKAGGISIYRNIKDCHREWNLLQHRKLALLKGEPEKQAEVALELCSSMGLVRSEIDERDNFGETPLIRAAAEGDR